MLTTYGGLAAQIVTPVVVDERVAAILSLHQLGTPRAWTDAEVGSVHGHGGPHRGASLMHNRWHPDIAPVVTVEPGEELTLDTEDGLAGQLTRASTHADCAALDLGLAHPLAGPVRGRRREAGRRARGRVPRAIARPTSASPP